MRIEFPTSPKNGSVAVSSDKETLIYRADDGFVGEDSFTVRVTDGFNYSEEVSVTVTVEPNSAQNVSQDGSETVDTDIDSQKTDNSFLIIIIFSVVGAIFLLAVVVKVKNNKKR